MLVSFEVLISSFSNFFDFEIVRFFQETLFSFRVTTKLLGPMLPLCCCFFFNINFHRSLLRVFSVSVLGITSTTLNTPLQISFLFTVKNVNIPGKPTTMLG